MIVVREPHTTRIMTGAKTMELRPARVKGAYFLADSTTHLVKGVVTFEGSRVLSQEDYEDTRHLHLCDQASKRYKKTVGTFIAGFIPLEEPVPYRARKGAIGYARYHS